MYRNASEETESARSAYLDAMDDVIMRQLTSGGSRLVSASSTGSQFTYDWADGIDLQMLAELSGWARGLIGASTIQEAVALVKPVVRLFRTSMLNESRYG